MTNFSDVLRTVNCNIIKFCEFLQEGSETAQQSDDAFYAHCLAQIQQAIETGSHADVFLDFNNWYPGIGHAVKSNTFKSNVYLSSAVGILKVRCDAIHARLSNHFNRQFSFQVCDGGAYCRL